jgi:hypothetical protein
MILSREMENSEILETEESPRADLWRELAKQIDASGETQQL